MRGSINTSYVRGELSNRLRGLLFDCSLSGSYAGDGHAEG